MITSLNLTHKCRVMIFAPHPDDETLATGGLLQQATAVGAAVRVIFATNGDNNPWPQRVIEHRWRIKVTDRIRWGVKRREEALAALTCLGIPSTHTVFLGYPDQGLTELLLSGSQELLIKIASEIASWNPTLLVIPSMLDIHPDHSALAVLVRLALAYLGQDQPPFTQLSYLVHPPKRRWNPADFVYLPLNPEQQIRKREAILCHKSQLMLSRGRLLAYAGDSEKFMPVPEPTPLEGQHPIHHVAISGSTLRFDIAIRILPSLSGKSLLYLIGDHTDTSTTRLVMELPVRPAKVDVREVISGTILTSALFYGTCWKGKILIPLSALLPVDRIFIKLERPFIFFDEGGWREISLPPLSHSVSSVTILQGKKLP